VRAAKFIEYLDDNPGDMEKVNSEFHALENVESTSIRESYNANAIIKSIRRSLSKNEAISRGKETTIAVLEVLMRRTLGDAKVDAILAAGNAPLPGSPENTPLLPSGGGQDEGSEIMGIVREPVEEAPQVASDHPPKAGEADVAIYGQGATTPITTTAAIIISGTSVTGK
jgi:hypothetical protein